MPKFGREPLYPHKTPSQRESGYLGGWKANDMAIYSDFGLRSLFIVQVMEWGAKPARFIDDLGITHDRLMGSVRAEIIDTRLADWDMNVKRISPWREVGTIHYYNYTNLYRNIQDLINKDAKVLYPKILRDLVEALKKAERWVVLEKYNLV